jgi:hypothetical protein
MFRDKIILAEQGTSVIAGVTVVTGRQAVSFQVSRWLLLLTLPVVLLLVSINCAAARQGEDLDTTIQYLINYVRESNVTFERNFGSHDAAEAAAHIEKKYQYFKDEIDTPEKFIELCATASLVTGKNYMVITSQGEQLPAGEWLNAELDRYRLQDGRQ